MVINKTSCQTFEGGGRDSLKNDSGGSNVKMRGVIIVLFRGRLFFGLVPLKVQNSKITTLTTVRALASKSRDAGSRDGAVVRALDSHQCGPGSIPRTRPQIWAEFVVGSRCCSEGCSPVFLPPQKPTFSKFQFDLEPTDTFERVPRALWWFVGK